MAKQPLRIVWFKPDPPPPPKKYSGTPSTIRLTCQTCKKEFNKAVGHYNYQLRKGNGLFFCSRACFYESRKHNKSVEQKKADKAEYDQQYRTRDPERKKQQRHEYFKRTYDPVQAAIDRQKRMPKHVEYCRRPEYKAKKAAYDVQHLAKKNFGEFWESALLIRDIESQYDQREVRQINNLHNKTQKRKRANGNNRQ